MSLDAVTPPADLDDPLRGHQVLFILALLLSVFSGFWGLAGVPVPLDRVLLLGSIAFYLSRHGRPRWRRDGSYLFVLMGVCTAQVIVSAYSAGSLLESYGFFNLLDRVVMPFAVFIYAPFALSTGRSRRLMINGLTCLGLYVGLMTVFSFLGPESLVIPQYIVDPQVGFTAGRGRGPSAEPVGTGLTLITCAVAAVLLLRGSGRWRIVAALSFASCSVGVVLTLTRSVWFAAVIVAALYWVRTPSNRRRSIRALAVVSLIAVSITSVYLLAPSVFNPISERFSAQRSLDDRAYTNAAALEILETKPLTGVGWGRFVDDGVGFVRQADTEPLTTVTIEVHNVFLSRASELGIVGLVLLIAIVVLGPLRTLVRPPATTEDPAFSWVAGASVVGWLIGAMFTGLSYPTPNLLAFALSGVVWSWLPGVTAPVTHEYQQGTHL